MIEYVREYLCQRLDPEAFRRHVEEQMAAYEEVEQKVSPLLCFSVS